MPLFTKRAPPLWYILHPPKSSTPDAQPQREGPYTRASIVQLHAMGKLSGGVLIWTNEKIFPNPLKPSSGRCVRIEEWRRFDQLPDPVTREIEIQSRAYFAASAAVHTEQTEERPPEVPSPAEIERLQNQGPPPAQGGVQTPQTPQPPPVQSVYPAGALTSKSSGGVYPTGALDSLEGKGSLPHQSADLPGAYPRPSVYPSAYPQSAPPPQ